jgi:hypothetical protein
MGDRHTVGAVRDVAILARPPSTSMRLAPSLRERQDRDRDVPIHLGGAGHLYADETGVVVLAA